jgi:DNA-nicking Smr family endonuclease
MAKPILRLSQLGALKKDLDEAARERAAAAAKEQRERARNAADATLFREAMEGVEPLAGDARRAPTPARPTAQARQRERDERAVLDESLSDEFDASTLLDSDEQLSWCRTGISEDVVRKLRRGHWVIQGELDLHGARREEAREALGEFVRESTRRGLRCLRVVHGKGLGSVDRQPVLKGRVFNWLTQKDEVLALCQARPQDGGGGALLVLLRPSSD